MQGHPQSRIRRPRGGLGAAGLAAVGLVLVAGCSVAPAGADNDSPAIGPTSAVSAGNFPVFPVPATYAGLGNQQYQAVTKAVTGTGPRTFEVDSEPDLKIWLSCLGSTGSAVADSAALGLNWTVPCGSGSAAEPQAINFQPSTGVAAGTLVKLLVTAPTGYRWELRIDVPSTSATAPPTPAPTPSQTP